MSLWLWVVAGAVLALILGLGSNGRGGRSAMNTPQTGSANPDERKAQLLDESLRMARTSKQRDTALHRLQLAETLLAELVADGSAWVDEDTERKRIARIRASFERRFPQRD